MEEYDEIEHVMVRSIRPGFTWFDNCVVDDYLPLLGTDVFALYGTYCRRAMGDNQKTKLAQEVIAAHLHISKSTVSEGIVLLEWCDLIKVVRRHRSISTIYLRQTRELTPEVIQKIRQRATDSGKYVKLCKSLLSRLDSFQSLPDRIGKFVTKSEERKINIVVAPQQAELPIPANPAPASNGNQPPETEPAEPVAEPKTELQKQWAEVLESLEMQMTQATFDGWLKATTLESMDSETWVVGCETSLVKDWLENRLATKIQRTVWLAAGSEDVDVKFIVRRRTILKK